MISGDNELFDYNSMGSDFGEVQELDRRRHIPIDSNSMKYLFWNETWTQVAYEYESNPLLFSNHTLGAKYLYLRMPTFWHLFGIFRT